MKTAGYYATVHGYCVMVHSPRGVFCHYTSGNTRRCSHTHVHPEDGVPLEQLQRWARQTALEFAREFHVPGERVIEDPDLAGDIPETTYATMD